MEVVGRVGLVVPARSHDPGGDACRLESLGFRHAVFPHDSTAQILLALGATRRLLILTDAAVIAQLQAIEELPSACLDRLEERDARDRPLTIDLANGGSALTAITDALAKGRGSGGLDAQQPGGRAAGDPLRGTASVRHLGRDPFRGRPGDPYSLEALADSWPSPPSCSAE